MSILSPFNQFEQLADNLDGQLSNYNQLLNLELLKVEALRKNDIDELTKITDDETDILKLLSMLESERLGLVGSMGFQGMTMSQILPYATSFEEREHMDKSFVELSQALNKLKDTNTITQGMATLRLHDTEMFLKALAPTPEPVLYKSDGTISANDKEKPKHTFKNERI
ncbi:MAG: flagellar protein FlgN [Oscillospiraceae bacterium]